MEKKTNKNSANSFVYTTKDPTITRVVYTLFILVMLLTLAVNLAAILLTASANQHNGMFFMGGKYYVACDGNTDGAPGAVFEQKSSYGTEKVGYVYFDEKGIAKVTVCQISSVNDGKYTLNTTTGEPFATDVEANQILGKFVQTLPQLTVNFVSGNSGFIIMSIAFVALTVVMGLFYFLVSPRGAKKFEKKDEEKKSNSTSATVVTDNAQLLMKYISTDDNIEPLELGENEAAANLNVNYYNSVKLHNGEVYTVVKKYPEAVRTLEEYGASDMDIIKMNMIGNVEFEKLILSPHKEKTMSMQDIIDFTSGLGGVYCIKKRGVLNWSFKYKSKTVIIIKQDEDNDGFKVAVKVYPDAATKLNVIYKALEDSTFPIGPFWYMFNNFRNLPGNVIKWLITESLKISKWQQTKADILRDTPTLESMQVDTLAIRNAILSGTKEFKADKFTVITQIADKDSVKYDTVLKTGYGKLDMSDFTKEITMLVPNTKNLQFSILTKKTMGDALLTSLCNELEELCNPPADYVAPTPTESDEAAAKPVATKSASGAKVVKRTTKKK